MCGEFKPGALVSTFKIYWGLTLCTRGFAFMFSHKEKISIFFCSHSLKGITPVCSAEPSKKNKVFPNIVGHFHPKKSDV